MDIKLKELESNIQNAGVIAVLIVDELKHAIPLAHALLEGGVRIIELTLRTPVAIDAGKLIKKELPEIILGFGTVITKEQVSAVINAGAAFAVAPGCNPRIVDEAAKKNLPFLPGVMTPTDIEVAIEHGCRLLKFFPAESSGGLKHLSSLAAPYKHLGLKFIPLGGCNQQNAASYLASPLVAAIGGSWIATADLIKKEAWESITRNAKEVVSLVKQAREKAIRNESISC